ncbi:hypothetical protein B0O99DRAFT_610954 [Bisporella sp. PMI_857]|nr:hypothetical protein B0O99DRAFT_610954 [Bisporella sp. PMI_857]
MKVLALASALTSFGLATALSNTGYELPTRRGCQVSNTGIALPVLSSARTRRQQVSAIPSTFSVDVHFHIASTEAEATLITDSIVAAQFDVLYQNYLKHNINLILASTSRVVDNLTGSAFLINEGNGWVYHKAEYDAYLKSTRKGGYDALNLYFSQATRPISANTMPGIRLTGHLRVNQGHIAVHEAGHWFGLNHTFVGGCSTTSAGDFCGGHACAEDGGLWMPCWAGYTNEFTPGQKARMFETFFNFRRKL